MGAALSQPPPPIAAPRKPGLRSTCPHRYEQSIAARDVLRAFVTRRRVTVRELAECWGVSLHVAQHKLSGDAPLHVGEILSLPNRVALELLDDVRALVLSRSLVSQG